MTKLNLKLAVASLLAAALLPPAAGQTLTRLGNDHPIVIEHLIALYDGLSSHIAARNAEDREGAASRELGAARIFGVSLEGYRRLGPVLAAAKLRLDAGAGSYEQRLAASSRCQPN